MSDRLRVSTVIGVWVLVYLLLSLLACRPPAPPTTPPSDPPEVYGELRIESTPWAVATLADGHESRRVIADADGIASIRLLPGAWRVQVCAEGYRCGQHVISVPAGGAAVLRAVLEPVSRGQLRIEGGMFVDDSGAVLPVMCHFGEALSAWTRRPEAVRQQLATIQDAGYYGIRVWMVLGGDYWRDREVGPDVTPGYWQQVESFLRALHGAGLVAEISAGDIGYIPDRREYAERMADACQDVGVSTCAVWESGNEAWQTGEPSAARLAEFASWFERSFEGRSNAPLIVLTSPGGYDEHGRDIAETAAGLDAYSIPPADMWVVHGYRGGHWWDKVRHIFSISYEQRPRLRLGWQNEPTGPGAAVSVTEHQEELDADTLSAMAAMSLIARQGWTYMSGAGVRWDYPLERELGFYAVPQVASLLPADVMSWPLLIHSGDSWAHERIFAATGETRIDCAMRGDEFCCLAYGPDEVTAMEPVRPVEITLDRRWGEHARLVVGARR